MVRCPPNVVVDSGGREVETYQYDALGRRVSTVTGTVTNYHVYDGVHCIADVDHQGDLVRTYTYGPGIDNILAITVHGFSETNTYYYLTDHLGSVLAITDSDGDVVETYDYDAWGRSTVYDAENLPLSASGIGNRYAFQGREISWASGLYYFRARWYDPVSGRWLSKDPIGISGGLNQYVAFGNSPVMFVDPLGLEGEWFPVGPGVPSGTIYSRSYDTAVVNSAIAHGASTLARGTLDLAGKIWTSPNTALGLAVGFAGVPFGAEISFGHNSIMFEKYPWMADSGIGLTLGNATLYRDNACEKYGEPYSVGEHEEPHTYQAQLLGPFYLPAYFVGGASAVFRGEKFSSPANFMEAGPYSYPPRTWK